jgi:hypothetical protein
MPRRAFARYFRLGNWNSESWGSMEDDWPGQRIGESRLCSILRNYQSKDGATMSDLK